MKKLLFFILNFCFVAAMGQNLIAPITISLPANPPANTADWAIAMPPVMINAQTKMQNGQIPGLVIESKILVTIKSGGSIICGSYTPQTAPQSNFNSATKTWSGAAVLGLLGKDCILKPGSYELCVQFYALNPAQGGLLGEQCKFFTIADTKQQTYSPPQNIVPVNGKVFTEQEANMPIMLRWTPVLPKPKADVNYKVRVIEILPGQNKTEALRNNAPIDIQEVKNQTQTNTKLSKRCNGCEYVWNVEASKKSAMGDIEMLGTSEATSFAVKPGDKNPEKFNPPVNQLPVDGKVFTEKEAAQPIVLRWTPVLPKPKADVIYKVKVWDIPIRQSRAQAIKNNKPIEILEVKNETQVTSKLSKRCNNCEYVWNVEASKKSTMGDIEMLGRSEATAFNVSSNETQLSCDCGGWELFTVNNKNYTCGQNVKWKCNEPIDFSARYNCKPNDGSCIARIECEVKKDGVIIKNFGSGPHPYIDHAKFTPTENGVYTITLYPTCNGKPCPPCILTFTVTDCITASNCDCKSVQCTKKLWYKDVSTGIIKEFACNTKTSIVLNCDKNYHFFADTKCSPDTSCKMIVKGEFRNAAGALVIQQTPFNSASSAFNIISGTPGNYTFTIRFYVNDVECGNCTIPITVSCNPPIDCCKNGNWYNKNWYYGNPLVLNGVGTAPVPLPTSGTNLGTWPCAIPSYGFHCSFACTNNCTAQVNYSVYNSATGTLISTQTIPNATYASIPAITTNGNYLLVIAAICGKDTCSNKLQYPFEIKCTPPINCCQNGTQKDPSVYDAAGTNLATFSCTQPKTYYIIPTNKNCDKELIIKASANCGPAANCTSKIVYTLVNTGTSTTLTGTGILTIPATLANGVYTLTVDYYCGNTICKSCKFNIKKDCPPSGNCCQNGTWGDIGYKKNGTNMWMPPVNGYLDIMYCNSDVRLKACFNCGSNCGTAQINYTVLNAANAIISTGTVANCAEYVLPIPTTGTHNYSLVIGAICGADTCKRVYKLEIDCQPLTNCCQGSYIKTPPTIKDVAGAVVQTLDCATPKTFYINAANKNCDKAFTISGAVFSCNAAIPNCFAKVVYTLVNTGTSAAITGTGILTIPATLANGTYTLTVDYYCGNTICKSCKFEIKKDCPTIPDDCCINSSWGEKIHYTSGGFTGGAVPKPLPASGSNLGVVNCGSTKQFKICYNCAQGCGSAQIKYDVYMAYSLVLVSSTTVASCTVANITMPATAGNYQIRIVAICNGKECNAMDYFINTECKPVDCCKGGKWTSKSLDWDIKIKVEQAEGTELSNDPVKKSIPQNKKDKKTPAGAKMKPVDIGSGQLNPLSGSLKVAKCGDTLKINEGNEFTFNAAYTCNAALANCTGKVIAKLKDPNGITYGPWPLPHLFNFATPGVYTVTYYAYCGETICASCNFYVNAEKDCCKGSKWIKADYQIVNKKPNGDPDRGNGAFYTLPTTIATIPTYKADLAVDVENLNYQCAASQGCNTGYIIRRKNLTTGALVYPDETLPPGQVSTSIYTKPFPQIITVTPTCGGKACGNPIIFKVECLNKDCLPYDNCLNQLIRNGGFTDNIISGYMPGSSVQYWTYGYGSPYLSGTPGTGCFDDGLVKLAGSWTSGGAIVQNLNSSNQIIAGKKYKVSMAVKFQANQNVLDYAKLRVIAFNGALPTSGNHPSPNSNIAIIGRTAKIRDCGDWSVRVFITWTANKNFQNIAINAFTDNITASTILIDNISICETDAASCDELTIDQQGNPIPPVGLQAVSSNSACYVETNESYYNGSLVDLYGYNGTFSMYETLNQNECNSIGDVLPGAITNYHCEDSLLANGITITCDSIDRLVNAALPLINDTIFKPDAPITPLTNNPNECLYGVAKSSAVANMAFNGRDIIYIHGLQLDHLIKRTQLDPRAVLNWPLNKSQFDVGGYYKLVAEANWDHHITHSIKNPGLQNRYFIASYNCSERADVAVYNIMSQIREAMENGTGVVADPTDVRGTKCFARDFIIISHSTGGLVADLVLSISDLTKTNMALQALYGNVGYIADRCKGHLAMHGAMGGSNLAKICVATALPIMLNSILVDLSPDYTYTKWGYFLDRVPKPVFTIAGGQPNNIEGSAVGLLLTALGRPDLGVIAGTAGTNLLPGIDDGVVNMESGSGRNKPFALPVSQFFTLLPNKAFDLGINLDRSVPFYLDQKRLPGFFSIGSTPYLTQSGMVEPHLNIVGMHAPWNNHYTFIQSAAEHMQPSAHVYYANGDYGKMNVIGSVNNEEQLVTNSLTPYSTGLIDPAIINEMGEQIRGKKIVFTWFKIVMKNGFPKFVTYDIEFYLWKRVYHNLVGNYYDVDYAYKYLFGN